MSLISDEELASKDYDEAICGQVGIELPDFIIDDSAPQVVGNDAVSVAAKMNEVDVCAIALVDYEFPESGAYRDTCEEFEQMVEDEDEVTKFLVYLYQQIPELAEIIAEFHMDVEDYDKGTTRVIDVGAPGDDSEEDWMTLKLYFEFW